MWNKNGVKKIMGEKSLNSKAIFALLVVFMFLFSVQAVSAVSVIHKGTKYGYNTDTGDYKFTWKTYKYNKNNVKMKFNLYLYDPGLNMPGYITFVKSKGKIKVKYYIKYGGKPEYKTFKTSKNAVQAYWKMKPYKIL